MLEKITRFSEAKYLLSSISDKKLKESVIDKFNWEKYAVVCHILWCKNASLIALHQLHSHSGYFRGGKNERFFGLWGMGNDKMEKWGKWGIKNYEMGNGRKLRIKWWKLWEFPVRVCNFKLLTHRNNGQPWYPPGDLRSEGVTQSVTDLSGISYILSICWFTTPRPRFKPRG